MCILPFDGIMESGWIGLISKKTIMFVHEENNEGADGVLILLCDYLYMKYNGGI